MRQRAAACKLGAMSDAKKRDPGGRGDSRADDQRTPASAKPGPAARPSSKPAAKPAARRSSSTKRRSTAAGRSAASAERDIASADQDVAPIEWGVAAIELGVKPKRQRKSAEPKRQRQAKELEQRQPKEPRQKRHSAEPAQQLSPATKSPPQSPLPKRQREDIATYGRSEEAGRHDLMNILGWSLVALASAVLIAVIVASVYILRVMLAS